MTMLALIAAVLIAGAHAQIPPVDRVAFSAQAGAQLPRDARFLDEHGHAVGLGDYLETRPAIVVPAYFACSNLCSLVAKGLASSIAASGLEAGRDVNVVVVSIDPSETPADALARKRITVGEDARGWHFLVGDSASVARLADALGYRYVYDQREHQYAHAAGIVVTRTGGRVNDVMYGVAYPPQALRASVRNAVPPVEGETTQWLLCFHYDPATGRYSFVAMNAVRSVAAGGVLALAVLVWRVRRRDRAGPRARIGPKRAARRAVP